jgi:phosphoribosylamine--glycine ligase
MRLKSDLFELLLRAVDGHLAQADLHWDRRVALGVVLAAAGYPATPRSGDAIRGLPDAAEDLQVFHAGSAERDGELISSGGRVLCVTALGETVKTAQQRAYQALAGIRLDGALHRTDIGHRAARR